MEKKAIEIKLSKTKMILSLFGAIAFVLVGIWLMVKSDQISDSTLRVPELVFGAGLISVLFFGAIVVVAANKLTDKTAGLIMNKQGIIDNASGVSAGLIYWSDIQGVQVTKFSSQRFLMIFVKNPQDYLQRISNPIKRNMMKMNYKMYGTPISISSNALQINFDNLEELVNRKMEEYK